MKGKKGKHYSGIVIMCGACDKVLSSGHIKITDAQNDAVNNGAVILEIVPDDDGMKFHCASCTKIGPTGERIRKDGSE